MEGKDRGPRPEPKGTDPLSLAFRELNEIRKFNRELVAAGVKELPLEEEAVAGLQVLIALAIKRAEAGVPVEVERRAPKPEKQGELEDQEIVELKEDELEAPADEEPELEGKDPDEEL